MGVTSNWCHPQGHHARRPPTTVPKKSKGIDDKKKELNQFLQFLVINSNSNSFYSIPFLFQFLELELASIPIPIPELTPDLIPNDPVNNKSGNGLVLKRQLVVTITNVDPLHIEAWTKWVPLCMWHIQLNILNGIYLYFDRNVTYFFHIGLIDIR